RCPLLAANHGHRARACSTQLRRPGGQRRPRYPPAPMPVDLKQLLTPPTTAVLVMECQNGILGPGAFGALGEAVERHGTIGQIKRVLDAARGVRVPVFYLTVARRADSAGGTANCLLLALGRKGEPLLLGSARHAVVQELAPHEGDWV